MMKERGTNLISYGLRARRRRRAWRPASPAGVRPASGDQHVNGVAALPLNTWTHIATTYDGVNQRFFVGGVQVASRAQTGAMLVGNQPLRIGGNDAFHRRHGARR
jgi:hypothetical protein